MRAPLEHLALKYDSVENHGWYDNLNLTVEQMLSEAQSGEVIVDYSGGTGILTQRLLEADPDFSGRIIIADSSPKFLRLAQAKFEHDDRVAFRLIRYLKEHRRLQTLDEVIDIRALGQPIDVITSTNAIHLYYGLADTLTSWRSVMKPAGRLYDQSGNMSNPEAEPDTWIIDETVEFIHREAMKLVAQDDRYSAYRGVMSDVGYMEQHDRLRQKYFLPVRPVSMYRERLVQAGFRIADVQCRSIEADVDEWHSFLAVYHEGVLGWIGGAQKVTGTPVGPDVAELRKGLMRDAMTQIFQGQSSFQANWTYIRALADG